MRVLFFGYSQIGARALELLHRRGDEIAGMVTHHDDPRENRWYRTPAEVAADLGIPLIYSDALGVRATDYARDLAPDLVLSVMYRDLLPEGVLTAGRLGALNVHPSLLPAYRGRAPINWVLVNGERETGVTLHHMVARADAGDIVGQRRIEIAPRETALSLYYKTEAESTSLLAEMLPLVAAGTAPRISQDGSKASKFGRRGPEDGRIDWHWDAHRVDCLVRAVAPPWPPAFFDVSSPAAGRVFVHAGEPADCVPPGTSPGTVRSEDGTLQVAAADRWFRIDDGAGLDLLG
ncbi:MAG: formyltransferase family protein [Acidobacteriota bacterium]